MSLVIDTALSDLMSSRHPYPMGSAAVDKMVRAVREHLGMDVAFVSQFRSKDRVFRHVDARQRSPIAAGDTLSLDDGYCQRVVDGRLPELIPDTQDCPDALGLPATAAVPIGSHLSVPIKLSDGSCYGTFCCFSFDADRSLGERDLQIMRVFAEILADQLDRDEARSMLLSERVRRIQSLIADNRLTIAYQPIYSLESNRVAGFECLSRFASEPPRPPNEWFHEAHEVGLGEELEVTAIRLALRGLELMRSPLYLNINCSPSLIESGALSQALRGVDMSRIVVEITEHDSIEDYAPICSQLTPLRAMGLRVAIDDAGAGYASLRHIINTKPDYIKLDISLTQNVDSDPTRRALAAALIAFAGETGARIIAEGVETASELAALRRLGIDKAQGYYLGRPAPLKDSVVLVDDRDSLSTLSESAPEKLGSHLPCQVRNR